MKEVAVAEVEAYKGRLLEMLRRSAFLKPSDGQPICSVDGSTASWILYTWNVTLTYEGATLAAFCILDRLKDFQSVQLASVGYTGLPLLSSCILQGHGKYFGLSVREERKRHGAVRRIDGHGDKNLPVAVIDDSLVSGSAAISAIEALEAEGFSVEGVLCLVNFPWGGGLETISSLGYKVGWVFDIERDLGVMAHGGYAGFDSLIPDMWDTPRIENGLNPAVVARKTAERYLLSGLIPGPPERFDREYDGGGGVFVSFRERDTNLRHGRSGFWHFSSDLADPCRDVVLATVAALDDSPWISLKTLDFLKPGVSFLGRLEHIPPGELDFNRYGIVVRSISGARIGGALPNTQYFIGEVEQYRQARWVNGLVTSYEPHEILAHTVEKVVEPGAYWLPFGSSYDPNLSWTTSDTIGQALTSRAREFLDAFSRKDGFNGAPLSDALIPAPIFAIGITIFRNGYLGCAITWDETLDVCVRRAVETAARDNRFPDHFEPGRAEDIAISVSVLHDQEWLGEVDLAYAADILRLGLDSLSVEYEGGGEMLLPFTFVYDDMTKEEAAHALISKAGDPGTPLLWAIYPTATWLDAHGKVSQIKFGYPDRSAAPYNGRALKESVRSLASYIMRQLRDDGMPRYQYDPINGTGVDDGPVARLTHALWALDEAGRSLNIRSFRRAAKNGLLKLLEYVCFLDDGTATLNYADQPSDPLADSVLLMALSSAGGDFVATNHSLCLAKRVRELLRCDGRITDKPEARGLEPDHDHLPGIAILSLAAYALVSGRREFCGDLGQVLKWYRRRFGFIHPWGMVGWHPQAWRAAHRVTGNPEYAEFVFEVCDWALSMQHEKSGAFLCDLMPEGFSFHTAFVAEAMVQASALCATMGMPDRRDRYKRSYEEAFRFMNRLIIAPEDTFCMREPEMALGGVRGALFMSGVRIDYVSHTLLAMAKALKIS